MCDRLMSIFGFVRKKRRISWEHERHINMMKNRTPNIAVFIPYHVIDPCEFDMVYESMLSIADQTVRYPVYVSLSFDTDEVRKQFQCYWTLNGLLDGDYTDALGPYDSTYYVWSHFRLFFHESSKTRFQHLQFLNLNITVDYIVFADITEIYALDRLAIIKRYICKTSQSVFTEKYAADDSCAFLRYTNIIMKQSHFSTFLRLATAYIERMFCEHLFVEYTLRCFEKIPSISPLVQIHDKRAAFSHAISLLGPFIEQMPKISVKKTQYWKQYNHELEEVLFAAIAICPSTEYVKTLNSIPVRNMTMHSLLCETSYINLYNRFKEIKIDLTAFYEKAKKEQAPCDCKDRLERVTV